MSIKNQLPKTKQPRQEIIVNRDNRIQEVNTITPESKYQGTIEKQMLEAIKNEGKVLDNIRSIIEIGNGIIEIWRIQEEGKIKVDIIKAKIEEEKIKTLAYIEKLKAQNNQKERKYQFINDIVREMNEFIENSKDLNSAQKIEVIKYFSSFVNNL